MVEPSVTPSPEVVDKKEVTPEPITTDAPKMVKESDLLAIKSAKEGLEQKLTESTTNFSDVQNKLYAAEAREKGLQEKLTEASASAEELKEIKPKLETAQAAVESLTSKALDTRRKLIALSFGIPVTSLEEKSLTQLDDYEEALKAVSAAKGIGNYVAGAGGGSGDAVPEAPIDRAKRLVKEAEEKRGIGIQVSEKIKVEGK